MKLKAEELKIDVFSVGDRSRGGHHGCRITHVPTGLVATSKDVAPYRDNQKSALTELERMVEMNMSVTEIVENKVIKYIADHGKEPKYVLMDTATYRGFSKSFLPKEKISPDPEDTVNATLSKLFIQGTSLDVLEVTNTKVGLELLEVVG